MNYANLTQKEIMSYADPKTELEIALMAVINDGLSELEHGADGYQQEAECLNQELEDCRAEICGLETSLAKCHEWAESISQAISSCDFKLKDDVLGFVALIQGE